MPRENSFSDSEGRSLTPDLEDDEDFEPRPSISSLPAVSPTYSSVPPSKGLPPISSSPTPAQRPEQKLDADAHFEAATSISHWTKPAPKERFRTAVRKVISMHRGTSFLAAGVGRGGGGAGGRVGAEPGVDPRRASAELQYGRIHQECKIEITDYSSIRSSFQRLDNQEFIDMVSDEVAGRRPPWVRVRWINIGGVSWDVIKALSLKYNLHPLALEDVFHGNNQNRSKADYYMKHLFLRVLCHQLTETESEEEPQIVPEIPRSASPEPLEDEFDDKTLARDSPPIMRIGTLKKKNKRPILPFHRNEATIEPAMPTNLVRLISEEGNRRSVYNTRQDPQLAKLDALKQGERVKVDVSPMFFFLFRDGTVISIHPTPNLGFTEPISQRLRQTDTLLRQSADPSLLVQALLDLIVDQALQVVDAYHKKIIKFEQQILLKPKNKTIRALHILSGDLILHKRTLEPIKTLVYGLRRYDVDRCAALIDSSDPANANVRVVGFMSHKSKIYLADVFDHMEYILTSLDMFTSIAENLINFSFNSASYEMNVTMRLLTLFTIIGLPLTLLTGYFGMNFTPMWSVQENSDLLFWKIAIPTFVVVATLALWQDFTQLYHHWNKKWNKRNGQPKIKTH